MARTTKSRVIRAAAGWCLVLLAAGVPLGYYLFVREDVLDVTGITLRRGRVEQTVSAISAGTVKPRLESMVAAGLLGTIVRIPEREGARVRQGAVLVELEHGELDAQVALAEANLRAGQSRLEQARLAARIYAETARTRVSQTQAQLDLARVDYERIRALSAKQAVSQSDLDKVTLALRVAEETAAAARASQEENQVRQEEIKTAEAAIEQLAEGVRAAEAMREKAFVRAPFDGVVAKVPVEVGEAVALGMPLVTLVQDAQFYVRAPFDEANASQIAVGQQARISLDAYRDRTFPGRVVFISPIVALNPDLSRTLDIDVEIEEGQEKFVAGMSADVIIVADEKPDVLYVPSEALIRDETAYVIENNRAVRRTIRAGIGNFLSREVLEGLKEGETLITSVTLKGLKNGVKVRLVDSLEEP